LSTAVDELIYSLFCAALVQDAAGARYNQKARHLSKIRAFMKPFKPPLFLIAVLVLFAGGTSAETADRGKPMNVEADALRYDDLKQTSLFTGRVVLTKGSILIRGEKIDVHQDPQGFQFGVVSAAPGKLAFFRQKREGLDEFIEGEAETLEYDGRADAVKFVKNAKLRRYLGATLNDEFTGEVIVYNNTTDMFTIDGAPAAGSSGKSSGRVRAMLTPKLGAVAPSPAAGASSAGPALRTTTTLGGEKK
jgi:lipopolysaccharide export system protein LptA